MRLSCEALCQRQAGGGLSRSTLVAVERGKWPAFASKTVGEITGRGAGCRQGIEATGALKTTLGLR